MIPLPIEESELDFVPLSVVDDEQNGKQLHGILVATLRGGLEKLRIQVLQVERSRIGLTLVIKTEDESNSRTILKQCFTEEKTDVTKIRQHLSWGEKNAFSLILFMYYANLQDSDLIILDDPISSFDTNKKYAILQRMFKNVGNKNVTFAGKTVLLLTHDFEPITDFIVVGKLDESKAVASFICNVEGKVIEKDINPEDDVKLILRECKEISTDENVNVVSRIAFLRKLCELNECRDAWGNAYEILSCLVHARPIKRKIASDVYEDMLPEEINEGLNKIKEFIPDFNYEELLENTYTITPSPGTTRCITTIRKPTWILWTMTPTPRATINFCTWVPRSTNRT